MKVGVLIEPRLPGAVEYVQELERLGVDSVWVPEVWGYDALTGLAFIAAKTSRIELGTFVVQLGSRSPALLATSALSLQVLSGDRFTLGVGVSGPRVMEGWHGVRFTKPVQMTRETIEIIRMVSRGERLQYDGSVYRLPLPDSRGHALRPMVAPGSVPVYVASMGPANLRMTGALADGWLGNAFIPESAEVFLGPLREGAEAHGRSLRDLDLVAPVAVEITTGEAETQEAQRRHANGYAFTIGAMGATAMGAAASENFYNAAFGRLGYSEEIASVAELWQSGRRDEARAAVPIELGSLTNLLGTRDDIEGRLQLYRDAGITTILAKLDGTYDKQLSIVSTILDLVRQL